MVEVVVGLALTVIGVVAGVRGANTLIQIGEKRERRMWAKFLSDHRGLSVGAALECMKVNAEAENCPHGEYK